MSETTSTSVRNRYSPDLTCTVTTATTDGKIDISGLNKVDLLRRLWDNMPPAAFFGNAPRLAPVFDDKQAEKVVR